MTVETRVASMVEMMVVTKAVKRAVRMVEPMVGMKVA
jgi:hypothetical protein